MNISTHLVKLAESEKESSHILTISVIKTYGKMKKPIDFYFKKCIIIVSKGGRK